MKFPAFFVHPLPLASVFLLALNDHYLKAAWPGRFTGLLSDVCGLFFFPLFLCAWFYFFILFTWRALAASIFLTDTVFIAIKIWPWATRAYVGILGELGFPSRAVTDPSDLLALGVNILLIWHSRRFIEA